MKIDNANALFFVIGWIAHIIYSLIKAIIKEKRGDKE